MGRAKHVEPCPRAAGLYRSITREAEPQVRRHFSDAGEGVFGRGALRRAEKLQQPTKLDRLGGRLIPRELQTTEPEAQRSECCVPLRFEFLGQRIVSIFRPTEPDLVDLEFVKRVLGLHKTGNMIPVLVRCQQEVDLALRGRDNVFDHFGHLGGRIRGAQDDSTIDQDPVRTVTIGTRQRNQKAIAQALSVHSDLRAIAARTLRICAGAAPSAFGIFLRLASHGALLSVHAMHHGERLAGGRFAREVVGAEPTGSIDSER